MGLYRKIKEWYGLFVQKKYTTIAGALVFFLILSAVPFSFWVTMLFGKILVGAEEVFRPELYGKIGEMLSFLRKNAEEASDGATFFLGATSLYSASNFFYHLRRCGEIVYDAPRRKRGWAVRLSALTAALATVLLLSIFWGLFLGMVWVFRRVLPSLLAGVCTYFLAAGIGFLTCFALNVYLCPFRVSWKKQLTGALVTTLLWGIALTLFSVYIRFGNVRRLYGAMTAVVVTLLWTYCMTVCFVIGVVVNEKACRGEGKLKRF